MMGFMPLFIVGDSHTLDDRNFFLLNFFAARVVCIFPSNTNNSSTENQHSTRLPYSRAVMNAPSRYELFVLEDGEKPCVSSLNHEPNA